jgi:hypothetical protein
VFTSAAAMSRAGLNYAGDSTSPELLRAAKVTWQWFDVFRARPVLGRVFLPEEDIPGAEHEVVLSYESWRNRFGGDPEIIGRAVQLNRESYRVVGVIGPELAWPVNNEMWIPLALKPSVYTDRNFRFRENLFGVARLREGTAVQEANAYLLQRSQQVRLLYSQTGSSFAERAGWREFCLPLIDYVSGDVRKPLSLLLAAVGSILLIGCANITGLQLARASGRQREISIQIALGASRARLA